MRHQRRVPKLGRPADQRKALIRGLTTQLIREGRVTTTKPRAKALRDEAERMISLAKDGSLASRRRAVARAWQTKGHAPSPRRSAAVFLSKLSISPSAFSQETWRMPATTAGHPGRLISGFVTIGLSIALLPAGQGTCCTEG